MNTSFCNPCESPLDDTDNFCRRCGSPASRPSLPILRRDTPLAVWQPQVSPVVKGAVVMAAGTVGQFVLRRLVSGVLGGKRSARSGAISVRSPRERDNLVDEAQIITETIMMRRVRIRRQA